MGQIRQFQRRAIEALRHGPGAAIPPPLEGVEVIQDTDGNQLYYAGVSRGIGTCSDVHGVDVLVLSQHETGLRAGSLSCQYSVLVRHPSDDERAADSLAQEGIARRCVELLEPLVHGNVPVFRLTGSTALYTAVA